MLLIELAWLRTGVFRRPGYWLSMPIVLGFMIPVDGWMTKLSDPIVIYDRDAISGARAPFDIPLEEFVYAVAMLTLAIVLWLRAGRAEGAAKDA